MIIEMNITTMLSGDRLFTRVEDAFGNSIYGIKPVYKLADIVSNFVATLPDQEKVEDLITALKESLRIASAYKVKDAA